MIPLEVKKELIYRNRSYFFQKEEFLLRDINYPSLINSPQITVITGVRRCGKSVLLKLISQKLLQDNKSENSIYYLNFNDPLLLNSNILDVENVFEKYFEMYSSKEKFLFLDEVQEIQGWHKLVLRFYDLGYKIFITGSNDNLLSKDISTYLTGRHQQIKLYPFSFKEILELKKINKELEHKGRMELLKIKRTYSEYFETGGFPQVVKLNQPELLLEYYESIIYRDVIVRNSVSFAKELKELSFFLLSNNTRIMSYKKLKETIGVKSLSTIKEYLDHLKNAFIFFTLNKYEPSIRTQITSSKKIYCVDNGLINNVAFKTSKDNGRLLENLVFLQLKRKSKEIYYYRNKGECDFLIRDGTSITQAIQVCFEITKENKEREITGLLEALQKFNLKEGLLLTYEKEDELIITEKQRKKYLIKIMPVWKWLLNEI